jgi:hypothetical protein
MHCRHAVGNYVGLFQGLFDVVYEAGAVDGQVEIRPGGTLGDALDIDEQKVASALAASVGPNLRESLLFGLVRTMLADKGTDPAKADFMIGRLAALLGDVDLPTFAEKGDALAAMLEELIDTPAGPSRAEADEVLAQFRSIGTIVSDIVGLEFPRLRDEVIPLTESPERWLELTGDYTVLLPSRASELLTMGFDDDRLTAVLHIDLLRLEGDATARFMRIDPRGRNEGEEQERHELLMALGASALGAFELHGAAIAFELDDRLERVAAVPFAPRHDLRRADWARPAASVRVERARIEIEPLWQRALGDLMGWPRDAVSALHGDLQDAVVDGINGLGLDDFPEVGADIRRYVGQVAGLLMPDAFVAKTARYRDPFVRLRTVDRDEVGGRRSFSGPAPARWEPELELVFDGLRTQSEPNGVAVRTAVPEPIEIEGRPIGGNDHLPELEDLDPPTGGRPRSSVRPGAARPAPAGTALADAERPRARQATAAAAEIGRVPEVGGRIVRAFDEGIWTMDHQARSPLPRDGGSRRDPGWYGLSTNCVVATTLYRSLRESGELERTGTARSGGRTLAWRVEGCTDVAADFSGRAPSDAPALAVSQLVVGIGPDHDQLASWTVDARLRMRPRFHGSGCLPDSAVQPVLDSLTCVEGLTGGRVPETTRLRQLEFRGFVFLGPDLAERERDVELISLRGDAASDPSSDDPVHTELRDVLAAWLAALPEVPVLYNPFRSIPGASDRGFSARGGWLSIERRYRFPDIAGLKLG